MKTKIFLWVIVVFAVVGAVNAYVVFSKTGNGGSVPCFIVSGCDQVQNSLYSKVFGIPLSLLGIMYYVMLGFFGGFLIGASRYKDVSWSTFRSLYSLLFVYVGFGFLFSLYLLYLQAFVIEAFCSSCLLSFADMIIITAGTYGIRVNQKLTSPDA